MGTMRPGGCSFGRPNGRPGELSDCSYPRLDAVGLRHSDPAGASNPQTPATDTTDLRRELRGSLRRRLVQMVLSSFLLWGGPANGADTAGLTLETGSPDALCPELGQAREAVRRRLGALEVEGRRGWRATYTIGHAPEGSPRDFIRLELFDPEGTLQLSRDLPIGAESCGTMAEVIALVLDRYFRTLTTVEAPEHSAPAISEAPPKPPPEMESAQKVQKTEEKPAPPAALPGSAVVARAPGRPVFSPPIPRTSSGSPLTVLSVEVAARLESPSPAFGFRYSRPLLGPLRVGAVLLYVLERRREDLPRGGSVSEQTLHLRGNLGWAGQLDGFCAYVGPELSLNLERGLAEGLPEQHQLYRAIWAAGVEAGVLVLATKRLIFTASAALSARIPGLSGKFTVDGREVLLSPHVQPWLGFGVGYAF